MVSNDHNFINFQLNDIEEESPKIQIQRFNSSITPKLNNFSNEELRYDYHLNPTSSADNNDDYDYDDIDEDLEDEDLYSENQETNTIEKMLKRAVGNMGTSKASNASNSFKRHITNKSSCNSNKKNVKWTKDEDDLLLDLVEKYDGRSWKKICSYIPGRSAIQCLHRWTKILKPGLVKGPWTPEEDTMLINYVKLYGAQDFSECSKIIKGRNNKQCRERWFNVLNPKVIKGEWSLEEDYLIFRLYNTFGGKWIKFIPFFNGLRAENSLKNRFYSTIRRFNTVLRKKGKDFDSENLKIQTIFADFKSQIMERHNLKTEKDLILFEKNKLNFDGLIDETRKDTREVFLSDNYKEKLGTNINQLDSYSFRDQFFLSQDKSNFPKGYTSNQTSQFITSNQSIRYGNSNNFHPRKNTISECNFRESSRNIENQSKISKTPFLKLKQPISITDFSLSAKKENPKKIISKEVAFVPSVVKEAQEASISQLEENIMSLCDVSKFTFRDEESNKIDKKLEKLREGFTYNNLNINNFGLHQINTNNDISNLNSIMQDDNTQMNLTLLVKQMIDLENVLNSTKRHLIENFTSQKFNFISNSSVNVNKGTLNFNPMSQEDDFISQTDRMSSNDLINFNLDDLW